MAKLRSDDLTLEIKFNSFKDEWILYEIIFFWKDEIITKDNILKRDGAWWKRNYGTFLANDYGEDHLIETINKVLETNKAEYWEPMEPDINMAIYPNVFFPFLESHWTPVEDEDMPKSEEIVQRENEKPKKEDDLFTIITFIDSYNFKNSIAYSGQGISLHLIVTRKDLETFISELEIEYNNIMRVQTQKHM